MGSSNGISTDEEFINKIRKIILQHITNDKFGTNELAEEVGLSRSQIHRKLIKASGKPVTQLIREIRLEEAFKLLKEKKLNASEVAYKVGFNSPAYFSKCFHEYYGITPGEVGKKEPLNRKKDIEPVSSKLINIFKSKTVAVFIFVLLIVWIVYHFAITQNNRENGLNPFTGSENNYSVAVMPFINNTGDSSLNYFEFGISELLINSLSKSKELTVVDNQIISEVKSDLSGWGKAGKEYGLHKEMAKRLMVKLFICGDYMLEDSVFRINMKIIDSNTGKILKTKHVDGEKSNIFFMADTLSSDIMNYLEIKSLKEDNIPEYSGFVTTTSPEAFRYYIMGLERFWNFEPSVPLFRKAIEIDSGFVSAWFYLSIHFASIGEFEQSRKIMEELYQRKEELSVENRRLVETTLSYYINKNPYIMIRYFKQRIEAEPLSRTYLLWLAAVYRSIEDYNSAISVFKRIQKLNKQLGDWNNQYFYNRYGYAYEKLKKYHKAEKIYMAGLKLFPNSSALTYRMAIICLLRDNADKANEYIEQYQKNFPFPNESMVLASTGNIYYEAGYINEAEKIYRKSLQMRLKDKNEIDTNNPGNNLYWYYAVLGKLLILQDINVEEGMKCLHKAKELSYSGYAEHPFIMGFIGVGLLKQGKYTEALDTLKIAYKNVTGYNHKFQTLIEKAEEAIARQENK